MEGLRDMAKRCSEIAYPGKHCNGQTITAPEQRRPSNTNAAVHTLHVQNGHCVVAEM